MDDDIPSAILQQKADQVLPLLIDLGLDCWLTVARETSLHPDPGVDLVVGVDVVRHSAFLFGRRGERIAIVANFDTAAVRATGVFHQVAGYDEDIRPSLTSALDRLSPGTIGLNYSVDDVTADGLTYGHRLWLDQLLAETPYVQRLTSAAPLLRSLRGRKTAGELTRIRHAVELTEQVVDRIAHHARAGITEAEVGDFVQACFAELKVATAWQPASCPIVNAGTASDFGHASPSRTLQLRPGQLLHVDLGVKWREYCSDLQRTWYLCRPGETTAPAEIVQAAAAVTAAIDAAAAVLRPGVPGYQVDDAARRAVVAAGFAEFKHAVGHGLGRAVHDGGTMLGPRWPCYGASVESAVEPGNVFTLELSVMTSSGCYGQEEDVVVTDTGCEFLSNYRREPRCLPFA